MGIAYLKDGTRMDYKDYIATSMDWQRVRKARFKFDDGKCVVCHEKFKYGDNFQTHHLNYLHLGQEHMRDVVTMCNSCHTKFHNVWVKNKYWKGNETGHWETFSLEHTAKLCTAYYKEDKFICKDENAPNLCSEDVARQYIDKYFKESKLDFYPLIDPHDIALYVRNKRYELFFEAEKRGLSVEAFLDECYGVKVRGKNPLRRDAGKKNGTFDHTPESFHKHYSENPNINKLMSYIEEKENKHE